MSLFGDLPPPTSHLRPRQANLAEEYQPASAPDGKSGGEESEEQEGGERQERPDKRQRVETRNSGLSDEQISAALAKITSHISNPDKFSKAAGLLRQLLDLGSLTKAHRDQLFDAVKAAFSDFDNASEASLRRDYMKLCHSLDRAAEQQQQLFSRPQRAQLEVYRIVGFTQNEMHTDDSFVFNKVLGRIKDAVGALPPASEEDEEALAELQEAAVGRGSSSDDDGEAGGCHRGERTAVARWVDAGEPSGSGGNSGGGSGAAEEGLGSERQAMGKEPHGGAEAAPSRGSGQAAGEAAGAEEAEAAEEEDDPFGLNQLLPAPKRPRPAPPPAAASRPAPPQQPRPQQPLAGGAGSHRRLGSCVWTAAQALVMRRQALIECLITARGFHRTPWARTSVELLVEHFAKHRDRFAAEQQVAVEEMVRFVRAARQARPTGPSQKEINRDTTSFERARSEWSKVHVSARGKVGASGDAKSNNWLG